MFLVIEMRKTCRTIHSEMLCRTPSGGTHYTTGSRIRAHAIGQNFPPVCETTKLRSRAYVLTASEHKHALDYIFAQTCSLDKVHVIPKTYITLTLLLSCNW